MVGRYVGSGRVIEGAVAAVTVNESIVVCVRLPDTPVNVTVAVLDGAVADAARLSPCDAPGARFSVAGEAVTPVGSPLTVTATVPLKPFAVVASSVTGEPEFPPVNVWLVGETESEKSAGGAGAAVTARATVAAWLSLPKVPVNTTFTLPTAAELLVDSVTVCAVPGVSAKVAGLAVTPAGSPVTATLTVCVNPLSGAAVTLICPLAPAATETLDELNARLKFSFEVPPQPAMPSATTIGNNNATTLFAIRHIG